MKIETVSVDSVMIYMGIIISEEVLDKVQNTYTRLKSLEHVVDLTPSYTSILLQYDIFHYDSVSIKNAIINHLSKGDRKYEMDRGKLIKIPVDYTQGLDLQSVADFHNISSQELIDKHTQPIYRVYAIGFLVGFAYLGIVDGSIKTPRLETPRTKVPKGSVGIAESQTAVYPEESAGGWNILGITEFDDFHLFEVGDSVRFTDARI